MDIALDPFPYNGTTTTCEALWMGVPVIALAGQAHVSRVSVSLLQNMGLGELLADSEDDYVRRAAKLASDADRLTGLRSTMRDRMSKSPLRDEVAFCARWRRIIARCGRSGAGGSARSTRDSEQREP